MNARHLEPRVFSRVDTLKVPIMDSMELLRLVGSVTTVVGAILVALNWSPRVTVAGFGIFIIASTAWMIDGWLEAKPSLLIQNVILLVVNLAGVYRWLPRSEHS